MNDFSGRTVYVTGGGRGMGLAAAKRFVGMGAHIVVFARSVGDDALVEIEAARRDSGQRIACYSMDIADRSKVLNAVAIAVAEAGTPDLVVNMAGIGGVAEFATMDFAMFDAMIQTNLYGSRHIVEAVLPYMEKRGHGKIVLVGSMAGFVPVFGYTAYGTSKFAVVGFAQCLRSELKPRGIDVACFCPGEVDTPGLAAEYEAAHPAAAAMKAIGGRISIDCAVNGLIDGIRSDQFMIIPGIRSQFVHWMLRLTPLPLWNAVSDVIVAHALRGGNAQ